MDMVRAPRNRQSLVGATCAPRPGWDDRMTDEAGLEQCLAAFARRDYGACHGARHIGTPG